MHSRRSFLAMAGLIGLASCAQSKFRTYNGPPVTRVQVFKSTRRLYLQSGRATLKEYPFELGFAPRGHKVFEGDGRTPEGHYYIDRRNPNSSYHLSVGISYPDAKDRERAAELELPPGGDIFIHGTPSMFEGRKDWTAGCIAVANDDIEEIYSMVGNGTPITIWPDVTVDEAPVDDIPERVVDLETDENGEVRLASLAELDGIPLDGSRY